MSEFIDAEVITIFEAGKKYPRPVRFRFVEQGDESVIINVDRVVEVDAPGVKADPTCVYKCESVIDRSIVRYDLNYRILKNEWSVRVH